MNRFVRPETAVLTISQGDTLTVKRRLNAGEQRAMFAQMYTAGVDGAMRANPMQSGVALVLAYLLDWSLVDESGKTVPIRDQPYATVKAALDALDPLSFAEVRQAIEQHDAAMDAERAEEKKMAASSA